MVLKNYQSGFTPACFSVLLIILAIAICSNVYAADIVKLPPINLGSTAFLDGMAGPGTLLQLSANLSRSDDFRNSEGNSLPGNNALNVTATTMQVAHITNYKIFDAFYGLEVLLPFADIRPDTNLPGLPDDGESGPGDLIISPFMLQWTNRSLMGKKYFHRLNLIFSVPTGSYLASNDVNTGSNLVKFNPYYAGTLLLTDQLSTSFRLHYLWNGKNTDPNPLLNAASIQPGTAFHMNYAIAYKVSSSLRLGLAGYYLDQLTEDRVDGVEQPNSKESIISIGPGLHYRDRNRFFNLNSYFESQGINRVEGYRVVARFAWIF